MQEPSPFIFTRTTFPPLGLDPFGTIVAVGLGTERSVYGERVSLPMVRSILDKGDRTVCYLSCQLLWASAAKSFRHEAAMMALYPLTAILGILCQDR
jgi:hypothetical protein